MILNTTYGQLVNEANITATHFDCGFNETGGLQPNDSGIDCGAFTGAQLFFNPSQALLQTDGLGNLVIAPGNQRTAPGAHYTRTHGGTWPGINQADLSLGTDIAVFEVVFTYEAGSTPEEIFRPRGSFFVKDLNSYGLLIHADQDLQTGSIFLGTGIIEDWSSGTRDNLFSPGTWVFRGEESTIAFTDGVKAAARIFIDPNQFGPLGTNTMLRLFEVNPDIDGSGVWTEIVPMGPTASAIRSQARAIGIGTPADNAEHLHPRIENFDDDVGGANMLVDRMRVYEISRLGQSSPMPTPEPTPIPPPTADGVIDPANITTTYYDCGFNEGPGLPVIHSGIDCGLLAGDLVWWTPPSAGALTDGNGNLVLSNPTCGDPNSVYIRTHGIMKPPVLQDTTEITVFEVYLSFESDGTPDDNILPRAGFWMKGIDGPGGPINALNTHVMYYGNGTQLPFTTSPNENALAIGHWISSPLNLGEDQHSIVFNPTTVAGLRMIIDPNTNGPLGASTMRINYEANPDVLGTGLWSLFVPTGDDADTLVSQQRAANNIPTAPPGGENLHARIVNMDCDGVAMLIDRARVYEVSALTTPPVNLVEPELWSIFE